MIEQIINFLLKNNKTISFAESCTGGSLSSIITKVPGASKVFNGSIVSYSHYSKTEILKVDKEKINKYSAVSQEVAIEMAINVREQFKTDYSISITGNAGPTTDGIKSKVGDYYVAISHSEGIYTQYNNFFTNNREEFIQVSVSESIKLFIDKIIKQ